MYPTLSDLLEDLFGIHVKLPIQSYGLMVAIAIIVGAAVLVAEFKRKEKENLLESLKKRVQIGLPASLKELAMSGFIGALVGYKLIAAIFDYSAFVDNPQVFMLSAQGSWLGAIAIGAASAYHTYWEKNKQKLAKPKFVEQIVHPHETVGVMLIYLVIAGVVGSKIFHLLENIDELFANPSKAIFSFDGLSFYGALVFGAAVAIWYARKNNMKLLHFIDAFAPVLAIGYGIGRIGCQISGDGCWGIANTSPKPDWLSFLPEWAWAYRYPHNVINSGSVFSPCNSGHCHILDVPVFPTPLYETTMMFVIFIILWSLRKRIKIPGILFSIYLIFAGIERFLIEKIRVNNVYDIFGAQITQAEIISSISIILGVTGIIILLRKKESLLKDY